MKKVPNDALFISGRDGITVKELLDILHRRLGTFTGLHLCAACPVTN